MKDVEVWKEEIEEYLTTHKSFAQFNQKFSKTAIARLEKYFTEQGYSVETRHCSQCSGYDLLIYRG
jgi:hypothetical protein